MVRSKKAHKKQFKTKEARDDWLRQETEEREKEVKRTLQTIRDLRAEEANLQEELERVDGETEAKGSERKDIVER